MAVHDETEEGNSRCSSRQFKQQLGTEGSRLITHFETDIKDKFPPLGFIAKRRGNGAHLTRNRLNLHGTRMSMGYGTSDFLFYMCYAIFKSSKCSIFKGTNFLKYSAFYTATWLLILPNKETFRH